MSGNIFEDTLSESNNKGDFVEFVLYDYFEYNGFRSRLMKVMSKNGNVDQRLREDRNIIIPDLLCEKRYSEMIFIESKSRWTTSGAIYGWKIKKSTFDSYCLFYDKIYSTANNIMKPINFYVGFAQVIHDGISFGTITCYFVRMEELMRLKPSLFWDDDGIYQAEWAKHRLANVAKRNIKINFSYDSWNNILQTKYCSDIYSKQRTTEYFTMNKYKKLFFDWMYENQ